MDKIHVILREAGLKPFDPVRNFTGYCIHTEQSSFGPVRHVVYFRTLSPWDILFLNQAQEAAVAALSAAGIQAEMTETIDGWPAVEFKLVTSKTYRRLRVHGSL